MFNRFIFGALLLLPFYALAGEYWHVEPGASSIKMLSMPTEPRQAALAGAGIASPRNAGETMRNPIAATVVNSPSLSFSKSEFSDYIGANRVSMLAHSLFGNWHLSAGIESLNYDEMQQYTEDGLEGLYFTAGTVAAQLGIARTFNSLSAGLTFRYVNQGIENDNIQGVLFDGGVKYNLLKYFAFGAVFNNFGWIISRAKEVSPLSVQAGITASYPLFLGFTGALSADLYRRNDPSKELRTGLEIMYKELFSVRFGYPVSGEENNALSAGFAIKLGFADIEYAYQNRAVLEANHIFGISIYF